MSEKEDRAGSEQDGLVSRASETGNILDEAALADLLYLGDALTDNDADQPLHGGDDPDAVLDDGGHSDQPLAPAGDPVALHRDAAPASLDDESYENPASPPRVSEPAGVDEFPVLERLVEGATEHELEEDDSPVLVNIIPEGPPDIPEEDDFPSEQSADATDELSQEMLDALIAAADADTPEVQGRDTLPPVMPEDEAARPGELPEVVEATPLAGLGAGASEEVGEAATSRTTRGASNRTLRLVAAAAAGVLACAGSFATLYQNQMRIPRLDALTEIGGLSLPEAMRQAEMMMRYGDYEGAEALLAGAIAQAPESETRKDATYLRLDALRRGLPFLAEPPDYTMLHVLIDKTLAAAPEHPKAPEALLWKAALYAQQTLPIAALDAYARLIELYPTAPVLDRALLAAARTALEIGKAQGAAEYARVYLQQFPQSPDVGQAHLILGDIYIAAGQYDDARTLYVRTAEAQPYSPAGAAALLRLGRLAIDRGNYRDAILQLEARMSTATTTEGNDEAYLLLAEAYRETGQLEKARATLQDLLSFFPDSPMLPDAYVGLSRVLEALGERDQAYRVAQQGGNLFPQDPKILRNLGEFAGFAGKTLDAAVAFLAADAAGAGDPALLLTAARYFTTGGWQEEALESYPRLVREYGDTYTALTGMIEEAELLFESGAEARAVEQLEHLSSATKGSPRRLPVLVSLSRMYQALNLSDEALSLAKEIAELSSEPEELAHAAMLLLDAGDEALAQQVLARFAIDQLQARSAYALLNALGRQLLEKAPTQSIAYLEEAQRNYPLARTLDGDMALLRAYLATDRPAAARRVVIGMEEHVASNRIDTPYLIDAAIEWGDFLHRRADYRSAADAYAIALNHAEVEGVVVDGLTQSTDWAKYQRANALLALSDYEESFRLFQEIAQSTAPWAQEAVTKAEFVRIEGKMRGVNLPKVAEAG